MSQRLSRLRERRTAGEHGFTLIELLVLMVIIGILVAIAVPLYLNYEKGAKDKAAESDLRNAITVLEQCKNDNLYYPEYLTPSANLVVSDPKASYCPGSSFNLSAGTLLSYTYNGDIRMMGPDLQDVGGTGYLLMTTNSGGSGKKYCYSTLHGGSITTTTHYMGYPWYGDLVTPGTC